MSKARDFGAGGGKFRQFGQGNYLRGSVEKTTPIPLADFKGGYDSRTVRDGVPADSSNNMLDMQVSKKNRLVRMPGTTGVETLTGHTVSQMVLHTSLGGSAELLFFEAPKLGIKSIGDTVWTDYELISSPDPWVWTVFGETLVFANGVETVYARDPGGIPRRIPDAPLANTYASFAARIYAGGAVIDGHYEPMGMAWSDASSVADNWDSLQGAGGELLIDETIPDDRIIANRTMGLNMMAILCRHSVRIAQLTGDPFRPADFSTRVVGAGCVNEATARATPIGVIYLSDDGLRAFDGNGSRIISDRINGEMLPLEMGALLQYVGVYNPLTNRYKLSTPTDSWEYDISADRFYHGTLTASAGTLFTEQAGGTTWAQLQAAGIVWTDLQTDQSRWRDLDAHALSDASMYYLYTPPGGDPVLHKEDPASMTIFGAPVVPMWESKYLRGGELNQLITMKAIHLEYCGGGTIRFYLPNNDGVYTEILSQPLQTTADFKTPREIWLPVIHTGMGAGVRVEIAIGATLEIVQMELVALERGPRIEQTPFLPREYFPDFNA